MKRFLLILFSIFFTVIAVQAKEINFVQVTDVHFHRTNPQPLTDFVNEINSQYKDLDFVVFTGDNIDKSNIQDLESFLSIIKNIKFKKYVLLGNHDVFVNQNLDKKLYMKTVRKYLGRYHSDKPNYVFKSGKIVFVVMDGVKQIIPGPGGYYKEPELQWLDKILTKYKNDKVVILQHFSLLTSSSATHNLYAKEKYLDVLSKHNNVIGIISGHYHCNMEENKYNVYNIVTTNFNNNNYHKKIVIDDNTGFIYTTLINKNTKSMQ